MFRLTMDFSEKEGAYDKLKKGEGGGNFISLK